MYLILYEAIKIVFSLFWRGSKVGPIEEIQRGLERCCTSTFLLLTCTCRLAPPPYPPSPLLCRSISLALTYHLNIFVTCYTLCVCLEWLKGGNGGQRDIGARRGGAARDKEYSYMAQQAIWDSTD